MNASNSTTPTIQAPPGHTPESDFAHLVAMRSGFVCAFCGATEGLIPSPIVPESYGGSTDASNFRSLCGPCDRLRHNAEGSSPNPPYPEDLQHLYDIGWPELTAGILSLLHEAATISEVSDGVWIKNWARGLAGWDLKRRPRPEAIAPDDWEFLCNGAYDVVFRSAYHLMPATPIRSRRRRHARRPA